MQGNAQQYQRRTLNSVLLIVIPIALSAIGTLATQAIYGAYFGGRAAQNIDSRLQGHTDDIADLRKQIEKLKEQVEKGDHELHEQLIKVDREGTRPAQMVEARVKRIEDDLRSLADKFDRFNSDIINQRTPLSGLVRDLTETVRNHSTQINELSLKVNRLEASKR